MNMLQAVKSVFSKYFTLSGRARRAEYWWYFLFVIIASVVLVLIDGAIGAAGALTVLFVVGTILPSIAVTIRRLHDVDRSGWWYFIVLVPLVGPIVQIVWACTKGTTGDNRFGPDPITTA